MIEAVQTLQNFIGGELISPIKGQYIDSVNPSTGAIFCKVPNSTTEDVDSAAKAAALAYLSWSETTRQQRSAMLHRLADLVEANLSELAEAESMDQGKTVRQALEKEIPRCVTNLRYFADLIKNYNELTTECEGLTSTRSYVRHEPVGVVAIITPWNLPLYLLTWKLAPALAMGNCVIAKPSELTSLTAYKLCHLIQQADFPKGVVNMVFGNGSDAGQAIISHPSVRAVSFTGGTLTGRKIAALAGSLGKRVSLELGGKNAAVVFADCDDLGAVATACVTSSFQNQGEICLCTSRIYVERPIYETFLQQFADRTKSLKVGNPKDRDTDVGAIVSKAHKEKILAYLKIAEEEKATFMAGGRSGRAVNVSDGYFIEPTILTNVSHESKIVQEEIFGPVVAVFPFDSEEEVISLVNDVEYGLAASIWTTNGPRSDRLARKVKTGVVWINCWMVRDLATPFGGVKSSGYGREGGIYSLEFFADTKTVTTRVE